LSAPYAARGGLEEWCKASCGAGKEFQKKFCQLLTPLGDVLEWCKELTFCQLLTPLGDVLEWCNAPFRAGMTIKKTKMHQKKSKIPKTNSLSRSVTSLNGD